MLLHATVPVFRSLLSPSHQHQHACTLHARLRLHATFAERGSSSTRALADSCVCSPSSRLIFFDAVAATNGSSPLVLLTPSPSPRRSGCVSESCGSSSSSGGCCLVRARGCCCGGGGLLLPLLHLDGRP